MRQVKLGWKGPQVSEVCFGSLTISPLQGLLTEKQGTEILRHAVSRGINWVDTAEIYQNYPQIRPILDEFPEVKVVSKTYAVTKAELYQSLERARLALNRDRIDFFLLHEQESFHTLRGHSQAWEGLLEAKAKGLVGYIGISTHAIEGVRAGALLPGLDVIHPLINYQGYGIIDGNLAEMLEAIDFAAQLGLGIYAMKVFAGGHLTREPEKALAFIRGVKGIQAIALGMSSREEIDFNLALLNGEEIPEKLYHAVTFRPRRLCVADWCEGCGQCLAACPQQALHLEKDRVVVTEQKCVLCGYCGRNCPHFCLKII